MRTTRAHAPILSVLAAAGVHHHTRYSRVLPHVDATWSSAGTQRSTRSIDRAPTHTHSHHNHRKESRQDCRECGTIVEEPYTNLVDLTVDATTGWEPRSPGRDAGEEADTEDDRITRSRRLQQRARTRPNNLKKGTRSYKVANPDRRRAPPHARSASYEKHDLWSPPATAINDFGRKHENDAAYLLTHEVLSYSFGHNP